jgi:hypothetical protein
MEVPLPAQAVEARKADSSRSARRVGFAPARRTAPDRRQQGDRLAVPVDLELFALLDRVEILSRVVAQLGEGDGSHGIYLLRSLIVLYRSLSWEGWAATKRGASEGCGEAFTDDLVHKRRRSPLILCATGPLVALIDGDNAAARSLSHGIEQSSPRRAAIHVLTVC